MCGFCSAALTDQWCLAWKGTGIVRPLACWILRGCRPPCNRCSLFQAMRWLPSGVLHPIRFGLQLIEGNFCTHCSPKQERQLPMFCRSIRFQISGNPSWFGGPRVCVSPDSICCPPCRLRKKDGISLLPMPFTLLLVIVILRLFHFQLLLHQTVGQSL